MKEKKEREGGWRIGRERGARLSELRRGRKAVGRWEESGRNKGATATVRSIELWANEKLPTIK